MIKIQNLQKYDRFNNEQIINLEMGSTGFVGLLGDNESGNKTLLNIIGGIESIDSGDVIVDNTSINELTETDLASYRNTYTGYISNDVNLINELSVSQNIALALEIQGYNKEEISKLVDETLVKFNLKKCKHRKPNEISELEKQKVKIARAVVKNPKFLLVDMIINKLEVEEITEVLDILKELSKDKLVIIATSDKDIVEHYSDRIIELKDGQIISDNIVNEDNLGVNNIKNSLVLKKSSLPYKTIFNITLKSIFKRKITTLFFMLTLVFFGLGTSFSQFDTAKVTGKTINKEGINTVWIYKPYTSNLFEKNNPPFSVTTSPELSRDVLSDISLLKEKYSNNTYNEVRLNYWNGVIFDRKNDWYSAPYYRFTKGDNIWIYENVDQFESSIMYGDILKEANDIYITDYLANLIVESKDNSIQMNSLIGEKFSLKNSIAQSMFDMSTYGYKSFEYNIAGIIKTDYEKYDYLKDCDDINKIRKSGYLFDVRTKYDKIITTRENIEYIDNNLLEETGIDLDNPYINENEALRFSRFYRLSVTTIFHDNNFMLLGNSKMPRNENEIVIPIEYLSIIVYSEGLGYPSKEQLIDNQDAYLNQYLNKKITLKYDKREDSYFSNPEVVERELTIVGVYTEKDERFIYNKAMVVNDDLYKEIYLESIWRNYEVELRGNEQDSIAFLQSLDELKFKHITPYNDFIYDLELKSDDNKNILYGLGFATLILYILTLLIYKLSDVNYREDEIHTLQVLGLRKIDVIKVLIIEGLIVGLLSIFIAFIISITNIFTEIQSIHLKDIYYGLQFIFVVTLVIVLILFSLVLKDDINKLKNLGAKRMDIFKIFGIDITIVGGLLLIVFYRVLSKINAVYSDSHIEFNKEFTYFLGLILGLVIIMFISSIAEKKKEENKEFKNPKRKVADYFKLLFEVNMIDRYKLSIKKVFIWLLFTVITYLTYSITVVIFNMFAINTTDIAYFLPYQNLPSLFIMIGVALIIFLLSRLIDHSRLKRNELLNKSTSKN